MNITRNVLIAAVIGITIGLVAMAPLLGVAAWKLLTAYLVADATGLALAWIVMRWDWRP